MAKELAARGAEEGTVVISEAQTLGRGRLGREWASPKGGIWFSIILRPEVHPKDASKLTFVAAVVVAVVVADMRWRPVVERRALVVVPVERCAREPCGARCAYGSPMDGGCPSVPRYTPHHSS